MDAEAFLPVGDGDGIFQALYSWFRISIGRQDSVEWDRYGEKMVYFAVLGALSVRLGDKPAVTKSVLSQRLLIALLANANNPISSDTLARSLWAERQEPAELRSALQINVHRLRQFLGDSSRIEHGPAGYRIIVGPGELDLEIFERLVERAVAMGAQPGAADLLDEALALWRGEPFAGFEDLPSLTEARSRVWEAYLSAVELRCAIDLNSGQGAAAIGRLPQVIAGHPFREQLRGLLMRALYQEGRLRATSARSRDS